MSGHVDTGGLLLPYQQEVFRQAGQLNVWEKSRRVGITWAFAARQVDIAARSKRAGGSNCNYMSTSQRLGRIYIAECARWAAGMEVAAQARGGTLGAEVLKDEVRFASGHSIRAVPSNPESVRGMDGDTGIDEAAFHVDLLEILKAADAVGDWGGQLTLISTHNGDQNPFNKLCEEIRRGGRAGTVHRVSIYDAFEQGLFERRCALRGVPHSTEAETAWLNAKRKSWGYSEEYEVIPSTGGGVYFARPLIEGAAVTGLAVARLDCQGDHLRKGKEERARIVENFLATEVHPRLDALLQTELHYIGGDVGRSADGDLSVFVLLAVDPRTMERRAVLVVELRGVPFDEQWMILRTMCRRAPKFTGGGIDKQGVGSWISEKAETYFGNVEAVPMSGEWYLRAMPKLRTAFEEAAIEHPDDLDLHDDLSLVKVIGGRPALPKTRNRCRRTGRPRHGDYAIALALANEKVPLPGPSDFRRVTEEDLDPRENPRTRARAKKRRRRQGL